MVLKLNVVTLWIVAMFENDVKMYGTQTEVPRIGSYIMFENDVKMYGTQTLLFYL